MPICPFPDAQPAFPHGDLAAGVDWPAGCRPAGREQRGVRADGGAASGHHSGGGPNLTPRCPWGLHGSVPPELRPQREPLLLVPHPSPLQLPTLRATPAHLLPEVCLFSP